MTATYAPRRGEEDEEEEGLDDSWRMRLQTRKKEKKNEAVQVRSRSSGNGGERKSAGEAGSQESAATGSTSIQGGACELTIRKAQAAGVGFHTTR